MISDDDSGKQTGTRPAPKRAAAATGAKNGRGDTDAAPAGSDAGKGDQFTKPLPAAAAGVCDPAEAAQAKAPSINGLDHTTDIVFAAAPEPGSAQAPEALGDTPKPDHALLSRRTEAAVETAFNSLAHTVLAQNSRTLEDLVREMLEPMLKAWLDDNLPNLVERLVRAEIERVSRGRG
jgi:hypothetical protein